MYNVHVYSVHVYMCTMYTVKLVTTVKWTKFTLSIVVYKPLVYIGIGYQITTKLQPNYNQITTKLQLVVHGGVGCDKCYWIWNRNCVFCNCCHDFIETMNYLIELWFLYNKLYFRLRNYKVYMRIYICMKDIR